MDSVSTQPKKKKNSNHNVWGLRRVSVEVSMPFLVKPLLKNRQYVAVEEGIFIVLPKEPLAIFLA
jgi:hypothetical protein